MSLSLRRRNPTCFYCGNRSAQKWNESLRQFQCQRCEAINYLDENGKVTEPPITSTADLSSPVRFASQEPRSISPPATSSDNVFCDTCLKNQHLLMENLASYLPSEDSPQYKEYLDAYETYRARLEERYPQVCSRCAPRVRERIKRASYVAKTDYLRRMVERTKAVGVPDDPARFWRSFILLLGGAGWWGSALFQLCWHAIASSPPLVTNSMHLYPSLDQDESPVSSSLYACARFATAQKRVDPNCAPLLATRMPVILFVAGSSLWWNNCLRKKYLRTGGRMTGLLDYYVLQLVTYSARVGAWWYLAEPESIGFDKTQTRAGHMFMAIFILFSTLFSSRLVELDNKPRFSFHTEEALILPDVPNSQPQQTQEDEDRAKRARELLSRKPPLLTPISSSLSSHHSQSDITTQWQLQRQQPVLEGNPPTPPPENDEDTGDAMDWTPSKPMPNFSSPVIHYSQQFQQPVQSSPSPFYGTLPPPPRPQAFELRQPAYMKPNRFVKAGEQEKQSLFAQMSLGGPSAPSLSTQQQQSPRVVSESAMTDASEESEKENTDKPPRRSQRQEFALAPGRLTLKEDVVDTGLESLFDVAFSIADTPKGIKVSQPNRSKKTATSSQKEQQQQHPIFGGPTSASMPRGRTGWLSTFMIFAVPIAILAIAAMFVRTSIYKPLLGFETAQVWHE